MDDIFIKVLKEMTIVTDMNINLKMYIHLHPSICISGRVLIIDTSKFIDLNLGNIYAIFNHNENYMVGLRYDPDDLHKYDTTISEECEHYMLQSSPLSVGDFKKYSFRIASNKCFVSNGYAFSMVVYDIMAVM